MTIAKVGIPGTKVGTGTLRTSTLAGRLTGND